MVSHLTYLHHPYAIKNDLKEKKQSKFVVWDVIVAVTSVVRVFIFETDPGHVALAILELTM